MSIVSEYCRWFQYATSIQHGCNESLTLLNPAKYLMKVNELFSSQPLLELDMGPRNLRTQATKIPALIGIEFEMYVPGQDSEQESQLEQDMSVDEYLGNNWHEELMNFFTSNRANSRRDVDNVITKMEDEYADWVKQQFKDWLESDEGQDELRNNIRQYLDQDDQDLDAKIEDIIQNQEIEYDNSVDELEDDFNERQEFEYFLRDEDLRKYSDVASRFNLDWPVWEEIPLGDNDLGSIAASFAHAVGRGVVPDRASNTEYGVITDASLTSGDQDYMGVEFMSPPLDLGNMIQDFHRVRAWALREGCWTDSTTGLHINVSLPNFNLDKLDYVKLVLLLGDKWVLQQFGRLGNKYAASALANIEKTLQRNPAGNVSDMVPTLLDHMRQQMITAAAAIIHYPVTEKYTSVNVKYNRIEFRSAGGNYLEEDPNKIIDLICRYIYVLHLAMNPELERQTYARKLYKVMNPTNVDNSAIDLFVQYGLGAINRNKLKQELQSRKDLKDLLQDYTASSSN